MAKVDESDTSCSVFASMSDAEPATLVRFVVGDSRTPTVVPQDQIAPTFGDPFAQLLLAEGRFPGSADELLELLDEAVGPGNNLGRQSQQSFVLGEGSQLPVSDDGDIGSTNRGMRFLVARGTAPQGPDVIISASHPSRGLVEVMAWDAERTGFNFYRNVDDGDSWVFAGNSADALRMRTTGKGPFESHPSGNLLMKELKFPWVHWHSFRANIFESAFSRDDERRRHPWFTERQGAEVCETAVVMPSVRRWTKARLQAAIADDGTVGDPRCILGQVLTTPTVNLVSSSRETATIDEGNIDLPPTFFVDADNLELVGLPGPPPFIAVDTTYAAAVDTFEFMLRDGDGFEQPGDTHFAFVVPERAFEDTELLSQALERGVVTPRLAAALLMVDFPNPVFSPRRAALLEHVPAKATTTDGGAAFEAAMAAKITEAAASAGAGGPEREFAELWDSGDDWPNAFGAQLNAYYTAVSGRLATLDGVMDITRLAESRRNKVRQMPIFETRLLFAETNIGDEDLAMAADATVVAQN